MLLLNKTEPATYTEAEYKQQSSGWLPPLRVTALACLHRVQSCEAHSGDDSTVPLFKMVSDRSLATELTALLFKYLPSAMVNIYSLWARNDISVTNILVSFLKGHYFIQLFFW